MIDKKETERMLFAADYLVNGHLPDDPTELRRKLLENFGEDIVYGFKYLVPDPGFLGAIKRTFGLGGMHEEESHLKDLIERVRDDDLKNYDIIARHLDLNYNRSSKKVIDGFKIDGALDYFDNFIHDLDFTGNVTKLQKERRPSAKTQLELWEAVQEFSQTKFAKLHSRDLPNALIESVKEHRVPPVLSDFFKLAEKYAKGGDVGASIEKMSKEIIVPMVEAIGESDTPTLNAITNYLKDNNKHEVFSEQRSGNFGEYLMEAYAEQAEKNRQETKSKSRIERLERGSIEGENDERNKIKGIQKLPRSSERKNPIQPKSNDGR